MGLEKDINQSTFRNEKQKAGINLIYTYHWLIEEIKNIVGKEDLTLQQFNILRILRGSHPQPLSTLQIRDRMLDKMSDTSRIVDRLVVKGLAAKKMSKSDKRLVDVTITDKGKRILQRLDLKSAQMDNLMNGLSEKELKSINKLLDKIRSITPLILIFLGFFFVKPITASAKTAREERVLSVPAADTLPTIASAPAFEFRGAWVASVDNIDWPSRKALPVDSQKAEFVRLVEMHYQNGMNALIVQIRPATDAFYPSPYEPWSEWLTGTQGKPPFPYYDPLQFMITETHKRGMEFHAWCNPYRAEFSIGKSSIAPTHITRIHPEWFLEYGGKRYFDPGNKEVQMFVNNVIRDVVTRYDVDAIHFDDYFYPYRISGKEFPDNASYMKYGGSLSKDDWRRSNVDSVILMLSNSIKEIKPNCQFGISPFGVWRNIDKDPDGSNTTAGQTNYDDLYADILLWLKNSWIDYVAPQLYWEFGHKAAPYEVLLDWWSKHSYGKHCYIGLGIYKAGSNQVWRDKTLLPRQLQALRNTPNIQGAIYFSSKSFLNNPNGWTDSLRNVYYKERALARTPIR